MRIKKRKSPQPDYALRPASPDDLDWLVRLRIETMTRHLQAAGDRLSPDDNERRVLDNFDSISIVTSGDRDIGMLKVVRGSDRWKLVQVQLLPGFQGRGIGTRIISDLLSEARRRRVPVTLSVLKASPAKRLYDRLGFRVVAEKQQSYEMQADA